MAQRCGDTDDDAFPSRRLQPGQPAQRPRTVHSLPPVNPFLDSLGRSSSAPALDSCPSPARPDPPRAALADLFAHVDPGADHGANRDPFGLVEAHPLSRVDVVPPLKPRSSVAAHRARSSTSSSVASALACRSSVSHSVGGGGSRCSQAPRASLSSVAFRSRDGDDDGRRTPVPRTLPPAILAAMALVAAQDAPPVERSPA